MAAPAEKQLIAALDIGSSKVSALIVTLGDDGRLTVLGTGQRESRGVKRGYVTDMEASEVAVREAVEIAERITVSTFLSGAGSAAITWISTPSRLAKSPIGCWTPCARSIV